MSPCRNKATYARICRVPTGGYLDGSVFHRRAAIEQWFATGARTSPTTNAQLDAITLVPNLTVKRLIAAELERRGRTV